MVEGFRVEGQNRLRATQILGDVDDHAVGPEGDDEIPFPERERGEERALDELAANASGDGGLEPGQGFVVGALSVS